MFVIRSSVFLICFISLSACQTLLTTQATDSNIIEAGSAQDQSSSKPYPLLLAALSKASKLTFRTEQENHAQSVLESNFTRQKSEWIDEFNTVVLSVTPMRTFEENSSYCREYKASMVQTIARREVTINSTACRDRNGIWVAK